MKIAPGFFMSRRAHPGRRGVFCRFQSKDDIEAAKRRRRRRIGKYVEETTMQPTKIAL
jgi:hypothetical protein